MKGWPAQTPPTCILRHQHRSLPRDDKLPRLAFGPDGKHCVIRAPGKTNDEAGPSDLSRARWRFVFRDLHQVRRFLASSRHPLLVQNSQPRDTTPRGFVLLANTAPRGDACETRDEQHDDENDDSTSHGEPPARCGAALIAPPAFAQSQTPGDLPSHPTTAACGCTGSRAGPCPRCRHRARG